MVIPKMNTQKKAAKGISHKRNCFPQKREIEIYRGTINKSAHSTNILATKSHKADSKTLFLWFFSPFRAKERSQEIIRKNNAKSILEAFSAEKKSISKMEKNNMAKELSNVNFLVLTILPKRKIERTRAIDANIFSKSWSYFNTKPKNLKVVAQKRTITKPNNTKKLIGFVLSKKEEIITSFRTN